MKVNFPKLAIAKSDWISFFLTLIATLIGVLIANSLSERSEKSRDKQFAIKRIHSSSQLVDNTFTLSNSIGKSIQFMKQDTSYTDEDIRSIVSNNPLPYPDYLSTTLENPAVLDNMSAFTYEQLYKHLLNLEKLAKFKTLSYYAEGLENIKSLLDLEVQYLQGELSMEELEEAYKRAEEQIHLNYQSNEFDDIP